MMRPDHGAPRRAYQAIDFDAALGRKRSTMLETIAMLKEQSDKSAARLIKRREGIMPPADMIVLDCLRQLRAIQAPELERHAAYALVDEISRGYLAASRGGKELARRAAAMLRAAGGGGKAEEVP